METLQGLVSNRCLREGAAACRTFDRGESILGGVKALFVLHDRTFGFMVQLTIYDSLVSMT